MSNQPGGLAELSQFIATKFQDLENTIQATFTNTEARVMDRLDMLHGETKLVEDHIVYPDPQAENVKIKQHNAAMYRAPGPKPTIRPLVNVRTGLPIEDFPSTLRILRELSANECRRILHCLNIKTEAGDDMYILRLKVQDVTL